MIPNKYKYKNEMMVGIVLAWIQSYSFWIWMEKMMNLPVSVSVLSFTRAKSCNVDVQFAPITWIHP